MISVVILGLGFSNKHEFATLFFGGAFTLPQGRKEAPNIILFCMQSAWYVKWNSTFKHTHTLFFVHICTHCTLFLCLTLIVAMTFILSNATL